MRRIFLPLVAVGLVVASCGSPRTLIRVSNKADGTETTISVKQGDGGSTSVDVHPALNVAVDTVTFGINRR